MSAEFTLLPQSANPETRTLWVLDWVQQMKVGQPIHPNQTVAFYQEPKPLEIGTYRAFECIFVSRLNHRKGCSMGVFFLN